MGDYKANRRPHHVSVRVYVSRSRKKALGVFSARVEHNPILIFNYTLIKLVSDTVKHQALSTDTVGCAIQIQKVSITPSYLN